MDLIGVTASAVAATLHVRTPQLQYNVILRVTSISHKCTTHKITSIVGFKTRIMFVIVIDESAICITIHASLIAA